MTSSVQAYGVDANSDRVRLERARTLLQSRLQNEIAVGANPGSPPGPASGVPASPSLIQVTVLPGCALFVVDARSLSPDTTQLQDLLPAMELGFGDLQVRRGGSFHEHPLQHRSIGEAS